MTPICKPVVNTHLGQMNGLQRATEAFRYAVLSIEFFISPEGQIRKWTRTTTRIAVFIAVPTFMAFPVVTVTLWELESWIHSLTTIAGKLIFLPIVALFAVISISIVLRILRAFIKR